MYSEKRALRLGEVYLMEFEGTDSEQRGVRPGVVFQNNTGNMHSSNIIALPLTSAIKKTSQPTHVLVRRSESGLLRDSMILCENPVVMSKTKVGKYLTTMSETHMAKIAEANLLASSAIAYLKPESLYRIRERAVTLNAA